MAGVQSSIESQSEIADILRDPAVRRQDISLAELLIRVFSRLDRGPGHERITGDLDLDESEPKQDSPPGACVPSEMLEGEQTDLEEKGWVDLTIDWDASPGGTVVFPMRVFWLGDKTGGDRHSMLWHMSPHTVTHFDLPWALDILPEFAEGDPRSYSDSEEAQAYRASLLAARTMPAVFLNLTDLAQHLRLTPKAMAKLSSDDLVNLIGRLRITLPELSKRVPDSLNLEGVLLVLHTGWVSTFMPRDEDLSSPFWTAAHPWTIHPWLEYAAIKSLIQRGVGGIAIDAMMADCPMYNSANIYPRRRAIAEAAKRFFPDSPDESKPGELPMRQPVHVSILSQFRILAESLAIPRSVEGWYPKDKSYFETDLFVCGLQTPFLVDAAPVTILARKPYYGSKEEDS
jgi:kynurenine formamidase